jgi:hypothetical protein
MPDIYAKGLIVSSDNRGGIAGHLGGHPLVTPGVKRTNSAADAGAVQPDYPARPRMENPADGEWLTCPGTAVRPVLDQWQV